MGRIVVITGVFGGIGYATAITFHKKGWTVIGVDKYSGQDTEDCVDEFLNFDISRVEDVREVFRLIKVKYGRIDCLVNNAAIQVSKSILETTEIEWDEVFANNVKSTFMCVKNAYSMLKESKGSIVNVSSVHAFCTSRNISAYAAAKGSVLAFTRAASLEFAEEGIRVNAVLPGAVDTGMLRSGLGRGHLMGDNIHELIGQLGLRHPIKRIGQPGEIAKAIYFLGDNENSSFITGQAFVVDGGALAQLSTES
ncbi:MAG TPA: SDR family oxidoreductase [Bacillota bacterium]|nr:SDR family oxidoreductase [Bacillota bacterium]